MCYRGKYNIRTDMYLREIKLHSAKKRFVTQRYVVVKIRGAQPFLVILTDEAAVFLTERKTSALLKVHYVLRVYKQTKTQSS